MFDGGDNHATKQLYLALICQHIKKVVPSNFFTERVEAAQSKEQLLQEFNEMLPRLTRTTLRSEAPFDLSFYLLCRHRTNAFKFFFEMISRWLVPGQRQNVQLLHACDFKVDDLSDEVYTLCDLVIKVEKQEDLEVIRRNLPTLEAEICLGVGSTYYAQRILEHKGLTAEEKTTMIQEHIANLVKRLPNSFDMDVFTEMQTILVTCRAEFQEVRSYRHLSRLVSIFYLFKRALKEAIVGDSNRRHLFVRLFKSKMQLNYGSQSVLSLAIGLNFLRDNEVLEEPHILKAVRKYVPGVTLVEGSFISHGSKSDRTLCLYVELKKEGDFSRAEVQRLREELPNDLKDHIEHLMHSVFMPQNEEETMRNILTLSHQLKFVRDLPQVVITFKEQTDLTVVFTVIVVSVLKGKPDFVRRRFNKVNSILSYQHDRTKMVGFVRKRYPKEATVFHLNLSKAKFLRGNHSLDLQKARQVIVNELAGIIGEFRDFNGGMIAKQSELFCAFKKLTDRAEWDDDFLMENFFYSLNPTVMRSVLEPVALAQLYRMFSAAIRERVRGDRGVKLQVLEEVERFCAVITFDDISFKDVILADIVELNIPSIELASTFVYAHGVPCLGLIYRSDDKVEREKFHRFLLRIAEQSPCLETQN